MIWFFECVLKSVIYFKLRLHELVSMYIASCAFTIVWFMNILIDIEVRLHEVKGIFAIVHCANVQNIHILIFVLGTFAIT